MSPRFEKDLSSLPSDALLRLPKQRVYLFGEEAFMRELAAELANRGVKGSVFTDLSALIDTLDHKVPALVITHSSDDGYPALAIQRHVDTHQRVPLIVLHPGDNRARYEGIVRLLRLPVGASTVAAMACAVLAQRAHILVRCPEVAPQPEAIDGVLRAIHALLVDVTRTAQSHLDRVGDSFVIRAEERLASNDIGTLVLRICWKDQRAMRFFVEAEGSCSVRGIRLTPQRGLWAQLRSLSGLENSVDDKDIDDLFLIDAPTQEHAAIRDAKPALLTMAPYLILAEAGPDLRTELDEVPRHDLAAVVSASLNLWRRWG